MTFLGKVFSFLVLLLSGWFFVISLAVNATHISHKTKLAALQTQAKQLETTNDELKKLVEQLRGSLSQEQLARKTALSSLQMQLDFAKEQLATANKDLGDKAAVLTAQTQQISETSDRVTLLTKQNETLKTEIDKIITDRNENRRKVIKLTDDLNSLKSVEADLVAERTKLQNDSTVFQALAETRGEALRVAGIKDPDDFPPSDLKGEITGTLGDKTYSISIGKDDGLREGHKLEVYRNGKYLGRLEVLSVKDDRSTGQILRPKGYVQVGDKVAAKIN